MPLDLSDRVQRKPRWPFPSLPFRSTTRPDTYRSFGRRFTLKRRSETDAQFRRRVSSVQEQERIEPSSQERSYWLLGPKAMQAGSLHCDLWRGAAVDLAGHDAIAVFPVSGWWKSHIGQRRVTDKGRYALVVSISAPDHDVDLYSEIAAIVEARTSTDVSF